MFEDDNEQDDYEKENYSRSNKDALTNNSAVKAAIFVFGLMICIIIIYVIISGSGSDSGAYNSSLPLSSAVKGTAKSGTNTATGINTSTSNVATETPVTTAAISLKAGSNDPMVQQLQQLLKDKGYLAQSVALANNFGSQTEAAVKAFQKEYNMPQTGVVDNNLYNMIQNAPDTRLQLKLGVTDPKVKDLQQLLKDKGYLDKSVALADNFGAKTQAAVIAFQKAKGYTQDGIVTNFIMQQLQAEPNKP